MSVLVWRPGLLTTVQDLGRWGYQKVGVPVGGPMDVYSHRLANLLVGNGEAAATLEITLIGPNLEFQQDGICAVAGAEFALAVDGAAISSNMAFAVASGAHLSFGTATRGARAYLAVAGGIDLPVMLGSCATHLASHLGPFGGRALKAGDALPIGRGTPRSPITDATAVERALPLPQGGGRLRVMWGPHESCFSEDCRKRFTQTRFRVSTQSNRMGYRLEGQPIARLIGEELLSDAVPFGSVQVPASGEPILLMADRGTTGGYPRIATVISADLPVAGQLSPGDWIEFLPCERDDAVAALRAQHERLESLDGCR